MLSWLAIALKSYSFCFCYCAFFCCSYSYCFFLFIYYSSLDFSLYSSLGSLATVTCYVFSSYSFWFFFSFLSSSSLAPLTFATNDLLFSLSWRNLMSAFSFSSLTLCYRFLLMGYSSSGMGTTCTYSLISSPFFLYSYNF